MQQQKFDMILERRIALMRDVLAAKSKEYATAGDKLHNFKDAAALQQCTPEQALVGMLTKHLVSVLDMVRTGQNYPRAVWDEKIGDAMNYLALLEAMTVETGRSTVP